jgi:glucokinase
MDNQLILALDLGGSSVKSALVANGQHLVGSVRVDETQSGASAAEILIILAAIIAGHLAKARDMYRIAFAFPRPFDYEQGVCLIHNQKKYVALYGLNVGASVREMRYRNDAEAAIMGEAFYGAELSYPRLIGLTLGTGLGSA